MTISKERLDQLLQGCERPEDLLAESGLMKELTIKLMERMLGAERTAHPGYEDGILIKPIGAMARQPSASRARTGISPSPCPATEMAVSSRNW